MRWYHKSAVFLLLALACAEFYVRGPARVLGTGDFNDFSVPYVASRLWLSGQDPYSPVNFVNVWVESGGERFVHRGSQTTTRAAYPPFTLVAISPLALLPWGIARDTFCVIAVLLLPAMIWAVLKLAGVGLSSRAGIAISLFTIAMAPIHTAIGGENVAVLATELAIIAAAVANPYTGGLIAGLAFCLKPQLGGWFLLFYFVTRQWPRIWSACCVTAAFAAISVYNLPHGWLQSYSRNLDAFLAIGSVNDFSSANPSRFELINLQVLGFDVFRDYALANVFAWIVTAFLVVWWLRRAQQERLAVLATITLIGLMPAYQRIYNAAVVVLAFAWAASHWSTLRAKLVAGACTVLLVPGAAILQRARDLHYIGTQIWDNRLLCIVVGDHVPLAMLICTTAVMSWLASPSEPGTALGSVSSTHKLP